MEKYIIRVTYEGFAGEIELDDFEIEASSLEEVYEEVRKIEYELEYTGLYTVLNTQVICT